MAGYMNKVMLLGNLGCGPRDADLPKRRTGADLQHRHRRDLDRPQQRRAPREDHLDIASVIFADGLIDVAEKYLRKGSKVMIEGKLENREWTDAQDIKRYTTEVTLRPFHWRAGPARRRSRRRPWRAQRRDPPRPGRPA